MNIGEVIKRRRQIKNITQAELAALLKVTPQAVSRWEMEEAKEAKPPLAHDFASKV